MLHDPALIKPNADNHRRTMADDVMDSKAKPLILLPNPMLPLPKPRRRPWKINQLMPIVYPGLANNCTYAADMLNLSNLPVDASPEQCLSWVRLFTDSLECGSDSATAVAVANESVNSKS